MTVSTVALLKSPAPSCRGVHIVFEHTLVFACSQVNSLACIEAVSHYAFREESYSLQKHTFSMETKNI